MKKNYYKSFAKLMNSYFSISIIPNIFNSINVQIEPS